MAKAVLGGMLFSIALAPPVSATADTPALRDYVRARLADSDGQLALAASNYRMALASDPANTDIALRSWHQALESGDMALALQSAQALDNANLLPPTGAVLQSVDALLRKDWKRARTLAERLDREENFAFLTPILRSWISLGEGKYAPVNTDVMTGFGSLTRRYVAEHTALQALSLRDTGRAVQQIDMALSARTTMLPGLRITAALRLAALGNKNKALAILPEDDRIYAAARAAIIAEKKLTVAAMTPAQGFGRLLFRLSQDIATDSSRGLSLAIARMASFSDPANAEFRIGIARQLVTAKQADDALVELDKVTNNRWYGAMAETARIDALRANDQSAAALTLASAIAARSDAGSAEQLRVANLLMDRNDYLQAAAFYRKAMQFYPVEAVPWSLYLLEGGALERGGEWAEAKAALSKAAELAPDEPIVLNYLGYAQVERGENIAQALTLLKKARALRPDDASITDSLGWAYFMAGDYAAAVPVLEEAVNGAPDDSTVNEHLGDALWAAGRRFEARYAWEAARVFATGNDLSRLDRKVQAGLTEQAKRP